MKKILLKDFSCLKSFTNLLKQNKIHRNSNQKVHNAEKVKETFFSEC